MQRGLLLLSRNETTKQNKDNAEGAIKKKVKIVQTPHTQALIGCVFLFSEISYFLKKKKVDFSPLGLHHLEQNMANLLAL